MEIENDGVEINLSFEQLSTKLFEQIKQDKDCKFIISSFFFKLNSSTVNDQTLSQLYFLYKDLSLKSLIILDKGTLTKVVGKSSKLSFFEAEGQKSTYICISEMYCSCPSFIFSVVNKNENSLVKLSRKKKKIKFSNSSVNIYYL